MYTILDLYVLAMLFHLRSTHICATKWNLVRVSIIYLKYLVHGNITHDGDIEVKYQVLTKQQ
jgi:hypothetical protein